MGGDGTGRASGFRGNFLSPLCAFAQPLVETRVMRRRTYRRIIENGRQDDNHLNALLLQALDHFPQFPLVRFKTPLLGLLKLSPALDSIGIIIASDIVHSKHDRCHSRAVRSDIPRIPLYAAINRVASAGRPFWV